MNRRDVLRKLAGMVGCCGAAVSVLPADEKCVCVLSTPADAILSDADVARIRKEWESLNVGPRLIILRPGMTLTAFRSTETGTGV